MAERRAAIPDDIARALRDEVGGRIDECVHCGFCLPACPTYVELGTEMDSPRGRIYLVQALARQRIDATPDVLTHLDRCLDCRACETSCPSGVRYGEIIEGARALLEPVRRRGAGARLLRRLALRVLLPNRWLLRWTTHPLRLWEWSGLRSLAERTRAGRLLPAGLRRIAALAPRVRSGPFLETAGAFQPRGERRGRVALFAGCVMNQMMAPVHRATARVLARNGYEVVVPRAQTCCGALHVHNGDREMARRLARRNLAALKHERIDHVVVNAAGCGTQLREYAHLLPDDPAADALSRMTVDPTVLLAAIDGVRFTQPVAERTVYDEPCHLLHAQQVSDAPRRLLAAVPGLELLPLEEAEMCCGSAGVYNLLQPELAGRVLARKLEHIAASGARLVVTANPGCQLQLEAGLCAAGHDVAVCHVMELLDRASREPGAD